MNKEFVSYEQALALKELGFDEPCMSSRDINNGEGLIQLPLYQQAFRWFREKHNLIGLVEGGYNEWRIFFGKDRNNNPKGMLQLNLVQNGN